MSQGLMLEILSKAALKSVKAAYSYRSYLYMHLPDVLTNVTVSIVSLPQNSCTHFVLRPGSEDINISLPEILDLKGI